MAPTPPAAQPARHRAVIDFDRSPDGQIIPAPAPATWRLGHLPGGGVVLTTFTLTGSTTVFYTADEARSLGQALLTAASGIVVANGHGG